MVVSPLKRMNLYTIFCFIALLAMASSESVPSAVASSVSAGTARGLLANGTETDSMATTTTVPQVDIYKTEAPQDIEYYDNSKARWTLVDILVASFFTLAAGWLVIAIFYSLLILFLLRLQARGELDIYDEDFGTFYFCGGRFSLHLSCILRRCAIQLEREYQERQMQHMRENQGNPVEGQPREIRVMTRGERRFALETLMANSKEGALCEAVPSPCSASSDPADPDGGNVCAICLDELDHKNAFSASHICVHRFHTACIMDWLERKQNTDCPCCRKNMVSDDEIWAIVKAKRKELRRELQGDEGSNGKILRWFLGTLRGRGGDTSAEDGDSSSTSGDSTESENMSRNGTRGNRSDNDGNLESNQLSAPSSELPDSGDTIGNENNV